MSTPPRAVPVDDVSLAIIEQLQQDGRRAYASIGKAVGLSEAAVRQRVQRLLETGLVRIVAVTDPTLAGQTRQATVGIRCAGSPDRVAAAVARLPEVQRVVVTTGSFDLLADVACEDDERLMALVGNGIRAVEGVVGTETLVHLGGVPARRRPRA